MPESLAYLRHASVRPEAIIRSEQIRSVPCHGCQIGALKNAATKLRDSPRLDCLLSQLAYHAYGHSVAQSLVIYSVTGPRSHGSIIGLHPLFPM